MKTAQWHSTSDLLVLLLLGCPVPLPPEGEGAAVVGGGTAGPPPGLMGHQLTTGGTALGNCVCVCVCVCMCVCCVCVCVQSGGIQTQVS